ncbi:MAG: hypothetical protein WCT19_00955 [Candidatus Paceibacterota bacterium]
MNDKLKIITGSVIILLIVIGLSLLVYSFWGFFTGTNNGNSVSGNSFPSSSGEYVQSTSSGSQLDNSDSSVSNTTDNEPESNNIYDTSRNIIPSIKDINGLNPGDGSNYSNLNTGTNPVLNSPAGASDKTSVSPTYDNNISNQYGNGNSYDSNGNPIVPVDPRYSQIRGQITITGVSSYSNDASGEYVTIQASAQNSGKILITGMQFRSDVTGSAVQIGKGVNLLFAKSSNISEPIYLEPGETAYLSSIFSPVVYSLKLNKCMGYLFNIVNLTPYVSVSCPLIKDEPLPKAPNQLNDQCLDYLDGMSNCQIPPSFNSLGPTDTGIIDNGDGTYSYSNYDLYNSSNSDPFFNLSRECQNFITARSDYSYCIENHKSDSDFYLPEWRVFLNHSARIWKNSREKIQLLDIQGKIVDEYVIN